MLATLFTGFYIIVDGFFIGQKLGDIGLAAINIAWPIAAFIQALGIAIGTACGILLKKHLTLKDEEGVRKTYLSTIYILIFFVLICFLISFFRDKLLYLIGANFETIELASLYIKFYLYSSLIVVFASAILPVLRNNGHYKKAALIMTLGTAINFILDYLFIYRLEIGLKGAALASVISQFVILILGIIILIKNKQIILKTNLDFKVIVTLLRKGVAPFILTFSAALIIIFYNKFCFAYGGNDTIAAYTVLAYIIYLPQYIAIGIGEGIQPVLTEHHTLQDKELKKYFYHTFLILVLLLVLMTILFAFLRQKLGYLFNLNEAAFTAYKEAYFYFILSFIFVGIIRIYASLFEATSQIIKADIIVLVEPLLTPLLLLIFTNYLATKGIWIAYLIIQIILALSSFLIKNINIKSCNKNTEEI